MIPEGINARKLLSETKFYEGFSRFNEQTGTYETWEESVSRVMGMHRNYYAEKMNEELEENIAKAETAYKNKTVLGSQRALQFGGEQMLKHQLKMYNCLSSYADRPEFFGEIFYSLLCGSGAGFSVQKHHVAKLPMIRPRNKQAKTHVVEDSIEGWAKAGDVLLSSFFIGGGKHPEYEGRKIYFDTNGIRKKGAMISGGFKAPGPEPLEKAISLVERLLTSIAEDGRLKPIHVYDIVMHFADAVLSGGVRRSATICLFSFDDEEMMMAKIGNWYAENPQRGRSNNSAIIVRDEIKKEDFDRIFENVKEFGEPGFVFVDSSEITVNPCVEIGMFPSLNGKSGFQGCNLTEINGSYCDTPEKFYELCEAASILGTLQAGYTDFKFHTQTTIDIFKREALLGVSVTGWMNNPELLFDKDVLRKGAEIVKKTNRKIAKLININPAARTTCVKPSGNASTLLGTASGIHAEHSKRYLRNVQINNQEEVAQLIKDRNPYMVEDSIWSSGNTDYAIGFPIVPNEGSIYKNDLTSLEFLEKVKLVQQNWVEYGTNVDLCIDKNVRHNVSNTVLVEDDNWYSVRDYIFENRFIFSGISLLSTSGDKDYYQSPFIEVLTEEELLKKYGPASFFASGLIVDATNGFPNLWEACRFSKEPDVSAQEVLDTRKEWKRRYHKFAETYFSGDLRKTEYCLKDVYILHKWYKITKNFKEVNFDSIKNIKYIDIDTTAAAACVGVNGGCEI